MSDLPADAGRAEDELWLEQQKLRVMQERVAQLHRLFRNRKNPLYAWKAMLHCFAHEQPLPDWCMAYIRGCSIALYGLTIQVVGEDFQQIVNATGKARSNDLLDPADAMKSLPAALDFPGRGSNAFSSLREDVALMEDATLRAMGDDDIWPISPDKALTMIKKRRCVDNKQAQRRVKRGQKLF